ncbi:MAG: hypothetical protein JETCAE03_25460 [Ignavibacteriaceae bacterium]|nr:T9SS type A sorting domain-containing protein [Ignavibacteriaceae bacterium]MEB2296407.1 T9SS type A sorting domain-containing protein [Ignavibacteria bacterium]GIK60064.1 MAG: hypothetical protein BroJett017_09540 [Ignavibacteriota bacterium]GJQ43048.1 MAG: hypothetical protein JETCAE03_25460 [Ignavibacteriaceae bacterium]
MKNIFTLLFSCALLTSSIAQQASDYFPSQTGFEWKFKQTPLDSLNNPVPSLAAFRIDSFASVANYEGRLANIIPTKTGPLSTIRYQPFLDSLFYNMEGTNGFEYFSISRIEEFLIELDSMGIDPNFSFLDFFTSLQDWYSTYRFASNINTEYTLISVDTTVGIYPLLFEYLGMRIDDETISTVLGNFDCKKFLLQWKVSYRLLPPPFPPVELIATNDTIWIAPDNWIVQDIIPSNPVDLSLLGIPPFYIPGLETKLTDEIVVSVPDDKTNPVSFILYQNYPNPFNPSTIIKFTIPVTLSGGEGSFVTLKVYDVLGNEVAVLVNEEKDPGIYEVDLDGSKLSSGIYIYRLTAGGFTDTKKLVLLK